MEPIKGIIFRLFAVIFFVAMFAMVKATAGEVPTGQAVFVRSGVVLFVVVAWLISRSELSIGLRVKSVKGHFWRSLFGTGALSLNFAALTFLPLPEITAIGYAAPLLTVLLAIWLLGEQVKMFRISAVLLGILGVAIIVEPRLTVFLDPDADNAVAIGAAIVLMAAFCNASAQIQISRLVRDEHPAAIAFYFAATSTFLAALTSVFGWVALSQAQAVLLIGCGICAGVGQICLTLSYRYAPASVVAPFEYSSILFALMVGYAGFGEIPSLQMLVGVAIVVSAGFIIIWREAQLGIEGAKTRAMNHLTDPATPSIDREDASDGVDGDQAENA